MSRANAMPRRTGWLPLLGALTGAACGGGHRGGGLPLIPDGTEPIESFEADRIAAGCTQLFRCHDVATVEGCIKGTLGLMSPQIVADVQAGVTKYDPHLGYHCVQVMLAQPCIGSYDPSSCQYAFTGTLPAGSACTLNTECRSGLCSKTNCGADCCPGICADGVAVRTGCETAAGVCPVNEDCSSSGTCSARVGVGGMCGNGLDCQADLICDSSLGPACRRPAALGEACATTFCDTAQSFCDSTTRVCRNPPAVGDPCTGVAECGLALDCVDGACAVPGVVGQPCVGATGSVQCQQGYAAHGGVDCVNAVCANTDFAARGLACASP